MAAGGVNGSVSSCSVSSTGARSAAVSFPASAGPPPIETHTETYTDLTADQYATFLAAFTAQAQVDTTVNGSGGCNGVTAHR